MHAETRPLFHGLLAQFKACAGCPVLANTSLNVGGGPIVRAPRDAFRCFMGTGIERLAAGRCYLRKEDPHPALAQSYERAFEPD